MLVPYAGVAIKARREDVAGRHYFSLDTGRHPGEGRDLLGGSGGEEPCRSITDGSASWEQAERLVHWVPRSPG